MHYMDNHNIEIQIGKDPICAVNSAKKAQFYHLYAGLKQLTQGLLPDSKGYNPTYN